MPCNCRKHKWERMRQSLKKKHNIKRHANEQICWQTKATQILLMRTGTRELHDCTSCFKFATETNDFKHCSGGRQFFNMYSDQRNDLAWGISGRWHWGMSERRNQLKEFSVRLAPSSWHQPNQGTLSSWNSDLLCVLKHELLVLWRTFTVVFFCNCTVEKLLPDEAVPGLLQAKTWFFLVRMRVWSSPFALL